MMRNEARRAPLARLLAVWTAVLAALALPAPGSAGPVEEADHSVALIIAMGPEGVSGGTGWAIAADGYLVTNNHVIEGASQLVVVTTEGGGPPKKNPAQVVWAAPDYDLALIHAPGLKMAPLPVTEWVPPKGIKVVAIGFPGAADENFGEGIIPESTVTDGIVGRILHVPWEDSPTAIDIVQHSAAINHGNSGGPLLDTCGRVIGINTQIVPAGENGVQPGISFASHADNLIAQLRAKVPQLPIKVESGACAPGGQQGMASGQPERAAAAGLSGWMLLAGLGIPAALVAAGVLAGQNRKRIVETYTEYRRRKGGVRPGPAPAPMPSPRPGPRSTGWMLSGRTGSGQPVDLRIAANSAPLAVGRDPARCQLLIDDNTVSRRHAMLESENGRLFVTDLGSANGTRVDGRKLGAERAPVAAGQQLRFGDAIIDRIRPG